MTQRSDGEESWGGRGGRGGVGGGRKLSFVIGMDYKKKKKCLLFFKDGGWRESDLGKVTKKKKKKKKKQLPIQNIQGMSEKTQCNQRQKRN